MNTELESIIESKGGLFFLDSEHSIKIFSKLFIDSNFCDKSV